VTETTLPDGDGNAGEAFAWPAALERMRGAYSDNTLRDCVQHFRRFEDWCATNGLIALPAEPEVVARHMDAVFQTHVFSTVQKRIYAIKMVSRGLGLPDPTGEEIVRLAVRRGKRTYGIRQNQAPAMTASILRRLMDACGDDLLGMRDRAMLKVGYDTLCRAGELVSIDVEDVRVLPDGTARVNIRKDKADHGGDGVAYLSSESVELLRAWLGGAGITQGPLFRPFLGEVVSKRFSKKSWLGRIKALAQSAGLDPELARTLNTQSLRVGAVQDLTVAGASILQIMRAGRWRHASQVALYAREAPVNVWGQTEGDGFPLVEGSQKWRRLRRAAAKPPGKAPRSAS
jgi:integrase